jgi:NAD(P)-dependent dehydrogenase (short-subunit alcohol dehydrogenase family)
MGGVALSKSMRAVVTGGGSGIGKSFCREIAARGGRVIAADIDLASAERTASDLGAGHHAVRCDVSRLEDVQSLADQADKLLGGVDVVINNAGVSAGGRVGDIAIEDWEWLIGVNLWGVIYGCHVFAPRFRAQKSGHIINVASAAGFGGMPMMAPYCVAKSGVMSLSESLASELAAEGVGVTVLCPTFIKTNIANSARVGDPQVREFGKRLVEGGISPDDVARITLDCADAGRLYAVPMSDARWLWRLRRLMPEKFVRMSTRVAKARAKKLGVVIDF